MEEEKLSGNIKGKKRAPSPPDTGSDQTKKKKKKGGSKSDVSKESVDSKGQVKKKRSKKSVNSGSPSEESSEVKIGGKSKKRSKKKETDMSSSESSASITSKEGKKKKRSKNNGSSEESIAASSNTKVKKKKKGSKTPSGESSVDSISKVKVKKKRSKSSLKGSDTDLERKKRKKGKKLGRKLSSTDSLTGSPLESKTVSFSNLDLHEGETKKESSKDTKGKEDSKSPKKQSREKKDVRLKQSIRLKRAASSLPALGISQDFEVITTRSAEDVGSPSIQDSLEMAHKNIEKEKLEAVKSITESILSHESFADVAIGSKPLIKTEDKATQCNFGTEKGVQGHTLQDKAVQGDQSKDEEKVHKVQRGTGSKTSMTSIGTDRRRIILRASKEGLLSTTQSVISQQHVAEKHKVQPKCVGLFGNVFRKKYCSPSCTGKPPDKPKHSGNKRARKRSSTDISYDSSTNLRKRSSVFSKIKIFCVRSPDTSKENSRKPSRRSSKHSITDYALPCPSNECSSDCPLRTNEKSQGEGSGKEYKSRSVQSNEALTKDESTKKK